MNDVGADLQQLEHEGLVKRNRLSPTKNEYVFKDDSRVIITEVGKEDIQKIEVRDHPKRYRFTIKLSNPDNIAYSEFWNEWSPQSKVHWLRAKEMLVAHLSDKIGIIRMD